MDDYRNVTERLISYRTRQGITQDDAAKALGVNQSTISRREQGADYSLEHYEMLGMTVEDIDWIICGLEKHSSDQVSAIGSYWNEKEVSLRVKEGIRFGLEHLPQVQERYSQEIRAMQMESVRGKEEGYSVLKSMKDLSGKTWDALASECHMTVRMLERYASREKVPNIKDMYYLCKVFHTRPSVILLNSAYQVTIIEEMLDLADASHRNRIKTYLEKII